jgi:hypothetical protein
VLSTPIKQTPEKISDIVDGIKVASESVGVSTWNSKSVGKTKRTRISSTT